MNHSVPCLSLHYETQIRRKVLRWANNLWAKHVINYWSKNICCLGILVKTNEGTVKWCAKKGSSCMFTNNLRSSTLLIYENDKLSVYGKYFPSSLYTIQRSRPASMCVNVQTESLGYWMMYREEGVRQIVTLGLQLLMKTWGWGKPTQKFSHTSHNASGCEINIYCVTKFKSLLLLSLLRNFWTAQKLKISNKIVKTFGIILGDSKWRRNESRSLCCFSLYCKSHQTKFPCYLINCAHSTSNHTFSICILKWIWKVFQALNVFFMMTKENLIMLHE